MSAPLLDPDTSGTATVLASALGIGAAFGWTLERAGLGNARKLAGQFYGTDFTVVKVMFSAIVTAMAPARRSAARPSGLRKRRSRRRRRKRR